MGKTISFSSPPSIGATTPNSATFTTSTSNQYQSVKRSDVTVANGDNHNLDISTGGFIKLEGPSAAYAITGFTGGADGRILRIYNSVSQTLTIKNEDSNSTAANRILTLTGSNVALRTDGQSAAEFIYDSEQSRWILKSYN